MTFADFNFNEQLAEGLSAMGFDTPTPIQAEAIPIILAGHDLIACAQTGTGKTAAYLLPILHNISNLHSPKINTLILAPTRELAQQIDQQIQGLAYFTGTTSMAIFGGGDGMVYEQQRRGIQHSANILIATPGRFLAHLASGIVKLETVQHLILDEADRMLDMGFQDDIMRIISFLPKKRQTLLFSATMPGRIRNLAKSILHEPQQVSLAISQPAVGIDQQIYKVHDSQKTPLIQMLLKDSAYGSIIIFAGTKEKVKEVYKALRALKIHVEAFHSDLKQAEREEILLNFKNRKVRVLVGTDVLSRGIDVEGIDLVINYDAPGDPEDYIHRIGRTARAATTGTAITLINERDQRKLMNIEKMIDRPVPEKELPAELGEPPVFRKPGTFSEGNRRGGGNNRNKNRKSGDKKPAGEAKPQNAEASAEAPKAGHSHEKNNRRKWRGKRKPNAGPHGSPPAVG
ncbi:ATP-dependent RNA helicase [Mucilaginibacter sp. PPCGB 2223]|uniref:DEAD/DEAH box helicase n=1 Tax=Mucilaginibacter sp. PPCGB 2223 TaxID=1886027 RepID=UPI000826BBC4|nr:DEAD/DEAH box helicase [Mucilaginibacter sp. PPCGB 2223]OCX50412.1 ATP-dependent RNA helicase [Mucilaginibacter sp. PPCGB 2223]